jgi:phenylpyruvate tautomerase PptA (4-oxalocrotonate tautomerase family)
MQPYVLNHVEPLFSVGRLTLNTTSSLRRRLWPPKAPAVIPNLKSSRKNMKKQGLVRDVSTHLCDHTLGFPELDLPNYSWMVYFQEKPMNSWMISGDTPMGNLHTMGCLIGIGSAGFQQR